MRMRYQFASVQSALIGLGILGVLTSAATPVHTASVIVSPQTVTLAPGATQHFSVNRGSKVRWRATGGAITSDGTYTAGSVAGSFTVTATRGGASDMATVVIAAVVPPPPPPPPPDPTPTTAIQIVPGDNIQSWVNAYPEGTAFLLKQGIHRRQTIIPKNGMSFIGEPGAVLDGENVAPRAFAGENTNTITVRGLRITRYLPPDAGAAVEAINTTGWVVENNEIDHNTNGSARAYGVRIGSGMILRGNRIHHNGWLGVAGYKAVNALIEGNEIYANPPALFNDTIGEAANIKLYDCGRITIRNNFVHDGPFRGIWVDTMQPEVTIEGNRVVNHGEAGIWYEVSYRGTIRGNYVENAGSNSYYSSGWLRGGGIQVTNSPDVSVLENTVVNSLNGIIGLDASGYPDGPYGKNELRNLLVQGNTIVMPRGQTGIAQNISNNAVYLSWNNQFVGNHYELQTNAKPFYWTNGNLDEWQWQAYGNDVTSSSFRR